MSKRAIGYVSNVSEKIRTNSKYAEEFIRAAVYNHDESIESALAAAINQYGHEEFSKKMNIPASNVTRLVSRLNNGRDLKIQTLRAAFEVLGISKNAQNELIFEGTVNIKRISVAKIWNQYREVEIKYGT